ncbi:MAG: GxxExxY protein [Planctomycetota bacterium]
MEDEELTGQIIACAFAVHNSLGAGFLESVYQKALAIELAKHDLSGVMEKKVPVYYEGEMVGDFRADLVIEDRVIVEIKAINQLAKAHEVQLVNYLVATNVPIGLLINFGTRSVEIKRKHRDRKSTNQPN